MNMIKTTFKSSEDIIIKLQQLKGKTKLKICKNLSIYYDEMNIRKFKFEDDFFLKVLEVLVKFVIKYYC